MIILIVGECGVGKTWVMSQLLKEQEAKTHKLGKFLFHETLDYIVIGKYDGSVFQGSDRLSMSVMTDLDKMLRYVHSLDKIAVFEGDRFMNKNFIKKAKPLIIKILGDGKGGRFKRGSNQTERQLKTIKTRVSNIKNNIETANSNECLQIIKSYENNQTPTS